MRKLRSLSYSLSLIKWKGKRKKKKSLSDRKPIAFQFWARNWQLTTRDRFLPYCCRFAKACWARVALDRKARECSLCARGSCMRCQWNLAFFQWRYPTRRWGSLDNLVREESFLWFRPVSRSVSTRRMPCCCPNPPAVDSEINRRLWWMTSAILSTIPFPTIFRATTWQFNIRYALSYSNSGISSFFYRIF